MKDHPYASLLPLLEGEAFDSLVADIKANGLMEPITVYQDMVLDGRNRLRACEAAGAEPQFLKFDGDDPLAFVLSLNLHRRHLTPSQRAMVGADLATMRQGARTDLRQPSASLPEVSQTQAAALSTASERGVRSAVFVEKKGSHELVQAVRDAKIAVSLAARLATASEAIQQRAVAEPERVHAFASKPALSRPMSTRNRTGRSASCSSSALRRRIRDGSAAPRVANRPTADRRPESAARAS